MELESFTDELNALVEMGPGALARFSASLNADWIEDALQASGSASVRRRKFPAEQAMWLVLGMGLFADRSIVDVVDHLQLVLPKAKSIARSAVTAARYRLGSEPLESLFRRTASAWSGKTDGYRGLSTFAVDGTCLRVQDSDENFEEFGKPGGRRGPADAGYPQLRMACLLNLSNRLLVDANFGSFATGEHTLAASLWSSVPPRSLTLLDRGFVNYAVFHSLVEQGDDRHVLVRFRKTEKPTLIKELSDGSALVRLTPSRTAVQKNPGIKGTSVEGRIIAYQHPNGKAGRLFTTLTDEREYPAQELIELYHQRWEIELGFDELKTHLLERRESLRSKKPDGVRQEVWGLLTLYNLIRYEMLGAAKQHGLDANRISFRSSVLWLRNFWQVTAWGVSPGTIPKHLKNLRSSLNVLFLPPRRSDRRFPRHVKIKMSNYARNRGKRTATEPK